jgi:hypothetical protein
MDIHKPKPVHDWRELLSEIGVIVIGVLIALGAEQVVDAIHWGHKVEALEGSIRSELSNDLGLALEQKVVHPCVVKYLDTLQLAVLANNVSTIKSLNDAGPPLFGRAWPRDTWTAALNAQVSDHLKEDRVTAYSRAFLRVGVQREFMQEMEALYPVALSGWLGLPRDVTVENQQLVAIQRLRSLEATRLLISNSLLEEDGPGLSTKPSMKYSAEDQAYSQACDIRIDLLQPSGGR